MLINGGFDRAREVFEPCFWKFMSILQQIESVLVTHSDADVLGGLSSFFAKKLADPEAKPTVLTILLNLVGYQRTATLKTPWSAEFLHIFEMIEKIKIKMNNESSTKLSQKECNNNN